MSETGHISPKIRDKARMSSAAQHSTQLPSYCTRIWKSTETKVTAGGI